MVDVATVTSKGQVTLPASLRKRMGLRKGSRIVFLEGAGGVQVLKEEDLEARFAVFEDRAKEIGLTPERLRDLVKEVKCRPLADALAEASPNPGKSIPSLEEVERSRPKIRRQVSRLIREARDGQGDRPPERKRRDKMAPR
ncbi:MAG: AbrB/MazE/SpoVT family DNA-binding domain-containing protein [Candidatus Thermoplasmatota archaeon]